MFITVIWTVLSFAGMALALWNLQECRQDRRAVQAGDGFLAGGLRDITARGNVRRMGSRVLVLALFVSIGLVVLVRAPEPIVGVIFVGALIAANVAIVYDTLMDRLERRQLDDVARTLLADEEESACP